MLKAQHMWKLGCLLLMLSVIMGAFAAHALKSTLDVQAKHWWDLAVSYQRTHALAILACALVHPYVINLKRLHWVCICFIVGTFFFCGSLYLMALTHIKILGAITPIGGSLWILAWGLACTLHWKVDPHES